MTRSTKTQILYALLGLYIAASMTYYVMGMTALYEKIIHGDAHVRVPYTTEDDDITIDTLTDEAKAAGLVKGDVVVGFNGEPYRGIDQWTRILRGGSQALHPGDQLKLAVRQGDGSIRDLQITLRGGRNLHGGLLVIAIALNSLPPLICLLIGCWVAWARPHDWNAWLILVLLTLVEALGEPPNWWPGAWLAFLGTWYLTFQVFGTLALVLFGVYFPERWRVDARYPILKRLLIGPILAAYPILFAIQWVQTFHAQAWTPQLNTLSTWVSNIVNPLNLMCVLVYWAAIIDKLRSATTADARRRMRVLCAGSVVGLGSLLIVFILLPHFFPDDHKTQPIRIAGAILLLAFPFSLAYVVLVQRALDVRIIVRMGTRYALARASIVVLEIAIGLFVVVRFLLPVFQKKENLGLAIPITIVGVSIFVKLFASRNSLSERLQLWLDKKFFREAYDAEIVLSELSEQARRFTETGPLIETISRRISEVLHVPEVCVFLRGANMRGGSIFHLQQSVGVALDTPIQFHESSSTIRNLARSNRPATLYREDPDGWFLLADERERQTLEDLHAELLLPLSGRDRLLGVMTLGAKRSEEAYSPADLRLLQSVSTQTGLALEISQLIHTLAQQASERQRIDREIEIAHEVQERLFPQDLPVIAGLTFAGACRPAQGIGGDYYDFIGLEHGLLGLAIGDISGKGISAALLMASLRASLRGVTMDTSNDLADVMQKVNRLVYEASADNRYATFFFAIYDPQTRLLRYVNAGHNPPIVVRGESTLSLDGGGPVIGLLQQAFYEEQQTTLQPGDIFIGYTDGISEAMTHADEEWGEERMIASAACARAKDAAMILQCIFDEADKFTAGAPQHDDMTLLLMKLDEVKPQSAAS
jgi:sigma-B regulation protein RsbU (phosphoserine phosphatase)